ncbi:hypothetical protein [Nocardioides daejeonensis]|uniref:thiolase family protein n=1 Tax=Nocardioides daejeonensis TaxID=1046556 RepID=UPI000D748FBE|nr:hypothetical protein [Nocardioides daejeonensis]
MSALPKTGPIAVIGGSHVRRSAGQRLEELVYETAKAALTSAQLDHADLDNIVLAASDELDGRGITSMLTAMPAGGYLKDVNKVTDSGLHALALAAMKVRAGQSNAVLVLSWDGPSEAQPMPIARTALEPFVERPIGFVDPMASAVRLERYLHDNKLDKSLLDELAKARWEQAGNPNGYQETLICSPLREGHFAPHLDSASAVVLSGCPDGRPIRAEFLASGWRTDNYYLDQREMPSHRLLARAVSDALSKAQISIDQIDHFDVDDSAIHHEVWAAEALGLADPGRGLQELIAAPDRFRRSASSAYAGHSALSAGLMRIASSSAEPGATALVHQAIGRAGQGQIAAVIRHTRTGEQS